MIKPRRLISKKKKYSGEQENTKSIIFPFCYKAQLSGHLVIVGLSLQIDAQGFVSRKYD